MPGSIEQRILEHAERRFEQGRNHFRARSMAASFALLLSERSADVKADANQLIVDMLETRGAEGVIYTIRMGDGAETGDDSDYVLVTERDGGLTGAKPFPLTGGLLEDRYHGRAATANYNPDHSKIS